MSLIFWKQIKHEAYILRISNAYFFSSTESVDEILSQLFYFEKKTHTQKRPNCEFYVYIFNYWRIYPERSFISGKS